MSTQKKNENIEIMNIKHVFTRDSKAISSQTQRREALINWPDLDEDRIYSLKESQQGIERSYLQGDVIRRGDPVGVYKLSLLANFIHCFL